MAATGRPLTVFAPCFFGWENKGDAALLFAMAGSLEREFGAVDLTLTSFTPDADAARFGRPFLRIPLDIHSVFGGGVRAVLRRRGHERLAAYAAMLHLLVFLVVMRAWVALHRRLPGAPVLLPRRVREVVRAIEQADVAVAVPGGYLLAPSFTNVWWLYHAATLALVAMLGKPLVLYPCSLGPFPGLHHAIARRILRRCDLVMVRERGSERIALSLGVDPAKVRVVPDTAFLFEDDGRGIADLAAIRPGLADLPKPWIGVSVRPYQSPNGAGPGARSEAYLGAVARAVDLAVEEFDASAVFVPQVVGGDGRGGDLDVARAVQARLARPERSALVDADLSPHALMALYAECELLIGARMHATILAMAAGTPAVAIAYGHKTTGTMELIGLSDYTVPIDEVETRLAPLVRRFWAERGTVRAGLPTRLAAVRGQAAGAAVEVRRLLSAAGPVPVGTAALGGGDGRS